jgi:capsular exopolysaccharide synthesis family protein
MVNLAAGVAVGLLLGIGLACAREFRDRSIHSRHDVLVATGVPVLGLIPRIPKARGRIALITGRRRITNAPPAPRPAITNGRRTDARTFTFLTGDGEAPGARVLEPEPAPAPPALPTPGGELTVSRWTNIVAEAYSLLLTNVTFARSGPPPKIVVITSPLAEDGKTTCSVNLAITLALRGAKPLLIDADLRRGVVHTTLVGERGPGLSEVLSRALPPGEAIRTVKVGEHGGQLHFLSTGAIPPNPSALLDSPAFPALLARLREEYDTIIIDSPPANIISDASVLGLHADGVLVVARSGATETAALTSAVEQLTRVGVPLLGVVLNDIDFKREAAYDSTYRAYNSSQYLSAGTES